MIFVFSNFFFLTFLKATKVIFCKIENTQKTLFAVFDKVKIELIIHFQIIILALILFFSLYYS